MSPKIKVMFKANDCYRDRKESRWLCKELQCLGSMLPMTIRANKRFVDTTTPEELNVNSPGFRFAAPRDHDRNLYLRRAMKVKRENISISPQWALYNIFPENLNAHYPKGFKGSLYDFHLRSPNIIFH